MRHGMRMSLDGRIENSGKEETSLLVPLNLCVFQLGTQLLSQLLPSLSATNDTLRFLRSKAKRLRIKILKNM